MSDFEIVGCCGMCDDECDCVNTRTCLADWQQQARRAEDALDAARAEAAGLRERLAALCAEAETNPSPLDPTRGYVAVSRVRAALRVDR